MLFLLHSKCACLKAFDRWQNIFETPKIYDSRLKYGPDNEMGLKVFKRVAVRLACVCVCARGVLQQKYSNTYKHRSQRPTTANTTEISERDIFKTAIRQFYCISSLVFIIKFVTQLIFITYSTAWLRGKWTTKLWKIPSTEDIKMYKTSLRIFPLFFHHNPKHTGNERNFFFLSLLKLKSWQSNTR